MLLEVAYILTIKILKDNKSREKGLIKESLFYLTLLQFTYQDYDRI